MLSSKKMFTCSIAFFCLCCFFIPANTCLSDDWEWQNPLPDGNYIEDIWVFQDNQILAVGNSGAIWHFNGNIWAPVDIGILADLEAIWATGSNIDDKVYVAGKEGTILLYDQNQWKIEPDTKNDDFKDIWEFNNYVFAVGSNIMILNKNTNSNTFINTTNKLNGVYGSSERDVFAVGEMGTILHYDGNQWTKGTSNTEKTLEAIWGNGSSEYYCVGEDGIILRYNNSLWSEIENNISYHLYDIQGKDSNIWITGGLWQNTGIVMKYDGSLFDSPAVLNNIPFSSIFISNTNDLYVAGSEIYKLKQGEWIRDDNFRAGEFKSIRDIWGDSTDNIFAVGDNGCLMHYNGISWERINVNISDHLNGIWGIDSNNIYAVGANGTILYYNGSLWSVVNKLTNNDLRDIWGSTNNQLFAVGANGTLLHFNDNAWQLINTQFQTSLNGIWGFADNSVYVVGDNGSIFHYNGLECNESTSNINEDLCSIWGENNKNIFAVGKNGMILKYNGQSWELNNQNITNVQLETIWGTNKEIFVAGEYGAIFRNDGNTWEKIHSGTTNWLAAGWAINEYDHLVAGFSGSILRYSKQRLFIQAPKYITETSSSIPITISVYPNVTDQNLQISLTSDQPQIIEPPVSEFIAAHTNIKTVNLTIKDNLTKNGHKRVRITAEANDYNSVNADIWVLDAQSVNEYMAEKNLKSVNGWDETTVFAMGSQGAIYSHKDDELKNISFPMENNFEDMWFASKNIAYAVGSSGNILAFNGFDWKFMVNNVGKNDLYGIWGINEHNVFAVGDNGTILHYDGNQWEEMESGTNKKLNSIWGTSEKNVYAVGESSTILHYDGTGWTAYMENANFDLYDIWGTNPDEIFIAGSDGMVFFFDGSNWKKMDIGLTTNLYGIWGSCAKEVFVVGEYGVIRYFDGNTWTPLFQSITDKTQIFWDVWGTNGKNVYIAGDNYLVHYNPAGIKLSSIHTQTVCENLSLNIPFQLIDANDFNNVQILGFSSNNQLIPNDSAHISFQGIDNNRSIVLTPMPGQTGQAIIRLTANESNNFPCITSFKVYVKSLREILIDFYNETNGDSWFINEGWKSPPLHTDNFALPGTECDWYGIECNNQKNTIISLSMESNGLKGKIPHDIFGLSLMETINLSYNHLSGEIPHEVTSLKQLRQLNIASNMISGHIPQNISKLDTLKNHLSDFRWNALITDNENVQNFIEEKQAGGDWKSTQTITPSDFIAIATHTDYLLQWQCIDYYQDDGGYELVYAIPGVSHSFKSLPMIDNKSSQQATLNQLYTDQTYQFGIRSVTKPHENNPNTVYSNYAFTNIKGNYHAPSIRISIPPSVKEGSSPSRGSVIIDTPQIIDLRVEVTSNDETIVPVPSTITINAGNKEAYFYLNVQNDYQYVPAKNIIITASAMSKVFTPVQIIVKDLETPYWKQQLSPTLNKLNAIWGYSQSNVFAVGDYGTVLHYDGKNWELMNTNTIENLHDIWGCSLKNIYAVGTSGTILHYDGFVWKKMQSNVDYDLNTITGVNEESIYAAGQSQAILSFDGVSWEEFIDNNASGDKKVYSEMTISDMWAYTENELIAIGFSKIDSSENTQTILQLEKNHVSINPNGLTLFTNGEHTGIWGVSEDNYLVTGFSTSLFQNTGAIYRKKGNELILSDIPETSTRMLDIWGASTNEVYAVGDKGTIFLFNGYQWNPMISGTDFQLNGIWGLRDSSIFIVGDQGTILHYISDKPDYSVWDSLDIQSGTVINDYVMASICVNLKEKSATKVLNIPMEEYSTGENYKIGTYDPIAGKYIEYGPDLLLETGKAYWFLVKNEQAFQFYGEAVSNVLNYDLPLLFNPETKNGWNMIGCPNMMDYEWSKLKVFIKNNSGDIVDPYGTHLSEAEIPFIFELSKDNLYINKFIYKWTEKKDLEGIDSNKNDGYSSNIEMIMIQNQGYWVESRSENVYLRFSRTAQTSINRKKLIRSTLEPSEANSSPPQPMGKLFEPTQQNKNDHVSDSFCFIKTCFY